MTTLTVNQKKCELDVDPTTPLLWMLREKLQLTGTKFGCGMALCGACTVHLDGESVRSCVTPLSRAAGKKVVTIEGLSPEFARPLQQAWITEDVPQCGYCQSGAKNAWAASANPAFRRSRLPWPTRYLL
jgi:isoquinoline 1-oxidoreductase alpha subunit